MSPIPARESRRRQQGCYRCGKPTEFLMTVAARELSENGSQDPNHRFGASTSRSHSFCKSCADTVWDEMLPPLEKR